MPDGSLCKFDELLANSADMRVLYPPGTKIEFQFAPKIISDTNSSEWLEKSIWAIEMLRLHAGSAGRRIVVEWEYVATDATFNAVKVSGIMTTLKSYFFAFKRAVYPVVSFQYTKVVPIQTFFRLRNLNITHGPEYINTPTAFHGSSGNNYYPLYSKVNAVLELATNCSGPVAAGTGGAAPAPGPGKINVPPINKKVVMEWY